jgi:two-component sensor histidine kinase
MSKPARNCQKCPCQCFEQAAILALSPRGKILNASQSLAKALGYSPAELKGKSLASLALPEEASKLAASLACHKRHKAKLKVSLLTQSGAPLSAWLFACRRQKSWLVRVEFSALEAEKRQRELLLREVHHRIKNNLQGIAGLLYNQALAHPELTELLATPIRQIHSIALLYNLYSHGQDQVFLCQLCQIIAQAGQGLSQAPIRFDIPYFKTIQVHDQEAVTLSLILNELLANAIKHGQGEILLAVRKQEQEAHVILKNRAQALTLDFTSDKGLGTGLKLVKALLPEGARLSFAYAEGELTATLSLRPPLVQFLS